MVVKNVEAKNSSEENIDYESVLKFLRKRGLRGTEDVLLNELRGNNAANSSAGTGPTGKNFKQNL